MDLPRTVTLMADVVTVGLSVFAVVALTILTWWRWSLYGLNRQADRRLLLADIVLILAAVEILLDATSDTIGVGPTHEVLHAIAIVCRGGFTAGAFTLVITFPADERRERAIRRTARDRRERR